MGEKLVCSGEPGNFPQLEVLVVVGLYNLEMVVVEEGGMPRLRDFMISGENIYNDMMKIRALGSYLEPVYPGKVKDSFVVKKRSSDPYDDFRSSMVEMIIERQIFGARDLEDLLRTFLSLNSYRHHRVIVQVYTEIWDALFSTLS
ncbi:hypothetical protein C3L33_03641, partial [Rhododendron williamsianum]